MRTTRFLAISVLLWAVCVDPVIAQREVPLVINEVMASNDITIADPQDEYDDWIEIYNYGDTAFDIGGMYLTDDLD